MGEAGMTVVGLTGGIATGKSTVARRLVALGIPVIDADQVARQIVEPGQPALEALVRRFGEGILDASGALDRSAMRQRILNDAEARQSLNAITHPAIFEAVARQLQALAAAGARRAVVEAALMVETGSYRQYPELIVVTCAPQTQLRRVMARDGMSEGDARALMATQLPLADKEAVATHLIRNDGDEATLVAQVDAVVAHWNRA
jgi:dephospho-CoA kinase